MLTYLGPLAFAMVPDTFPLNILRLVYDSQYGICCLRG